MAKKTTTPATPPPSTALQQKLSRAMADYIRLRDEITTLTEAKERAGDVMKETLALFPDQKFIADGYKASVSTTQRSTIDRGKLLEAGISVKIIRDATITTQSARLDVRALAEKPGQD